MFLPLREKGEYIFILRMGETLKDSPSFYLLYPGPVTQHVAVHNPRVEPRKRKPAFALRAETREKPE